MVIEPCNLEKATSLLPPHGQSWCSPSAKSLGQPFHSLWPCPAVFSPTGGSECCHRAQIFGAHLPERLLSQNLTCGSWVVWLHCRETMPISSVSSAHALLPTQDSFDLPLWQPGSLPAELSPVGASESYSELGPLVLTSSKAIAHSSHRFTCITFNRRVSRSVSASPSGSVLLNSALGAGTFRMPSPSKAFVWD